MIIKIISKVTELFLPFGTAKLPLGMIMLGSLKKTGPVFRETRKALISERF